MTHLTCREADNTAGAIALGEATDSERNAYRSHVASCPACLQANGGEREIERTVAVVHQAREDETWAPDVERAMRIRANRPSRIARVAFSVTSACVIVFVGFHFFAQSAFARITPTFTDPLIVHYDGQHITLEKRSTEQQEAQHAKTVVAAAPAPQQARMVVVHNVVTLQSGPAAAAQPQHQVVAQAPAPRKTISKTDPSATQSSSVPVWRQGGGAFTTVAHTTTTLSEAAAPPAREPSVSVAAAYSTREAEPLGGETAINPRPPAIAYAQGASGTTVFQVSVDERGVPTKCSITKSSGYLSLDDAVCKAAMDAHYSPRTVNGKPEQGTYTDAFTFRSNDNDTVPNPQGVNGTGTGTTGNNQPGQQNDSDSGNINQ